MVVHSSLPSENLSCSSVCVFQLVTIQSVFHMWYCSVGKANVFVACTFLDMEILLDQITDTRLSIR